MIFVDKLS